MRVIDKIIIHCSDSDNPKHDNVETIRAWHIERGFTDIGYHYFISKDGIVHAGRDESTVGAHVAGHNSQSIGICLSGRNGFTGSQFRALKDLVNDLCVGYGLDVKTQVKGHRDLQPGKTCPNFEVQEKL